MKWTDTQGTDLSPVLAKIASLEHLNAFCRHMCVYLSVCAFVWGPEDSLVCHPQKHYFRHHIGRKE